jgi:hypothetical protein
MKKQILSEEFRRMQKLAGILKEEMHVDSQGKLHTTAMTGPETLLKNQKYIEKYVPIEDRKNFFNLGKNVIINKPYTIKKIVQAVKPIVAKEAWYDPNNNNFGADSDTINSVLKEFSEWLKSHIGSYNFILNKDKLTAREIYEQIYYDYVFNVNELDIDQDLITTLLYQDSDVKDDSSNSKVKDDDEDDNNGYYFSYN